MTMKMELEAIDGNELANAQKQLTMAPENAQSQQYYWMRIVVISLRWLCILATLVKLLSNGEGQKLI